MQQKTVTPRLVNSRGDLRRTKGFANCPALMGFLKCKRQALAYVVTDGFSENYGFDKTDERCPIRNTIKYNKAKLKCVGVLATQPTLGHLLVSNVGNQ